jgi:archaellum component FlaC
MSPHFHPFHKNVKQIKNQPDRIGELEHEIKELRKEIKQININVEELLKRKLSVVDYFNRKK